MRIWACCFEHFKRYVVVALLIIIWWTSAVAVTLELKYAINAKKKDAGKSYPLTLTVVANFCTALVTTLFTCKLLTRLWTKQDARPEARSLTQDNTVAFEGRVESDVPTDVGYNNFSCKNSCRLLVLCTKKVYNWISLDNVYFVTCVLGLLQAIALAAKNQALANLTVASRGMIFAVGPFVIMVMARLSGLETMTWLSGLAGIVLFLGSGLEGIWMLCKTDEQEKQTREDLGACFLAFLSVVLDALRYIILQFYYLAQKKPVVATDEGNLESLQTVRNTPVKTMGKWKLVSVVLWWCFPASFMLAWKFEPNGIKELVTDPGNLLGSRANGFQLIIFFGIMTFGVAGINLTEFGLVHLTSAVALNVVAALHGIPILVAGVYVNHDPIKNIEVVGFAICVIGAILYALAKSDAVEPMISFFRSCFQFRSRRTVARIQ